jgi:predicted CXXCH cytochrome family protein
MTKRPHPQLLNVAVFSLLTIGFCLVSARAYRLVSDKKSITQQLRVTPHQRGTPYVGSEECQSCHPQAYASWHSSYHRTMTQRVQPTTVLASFSPQTLTNDDGSFRIEQRGQEFWAEVIHPTWLFARAQGKTVPHPPPKSWQRLVMSTGSHHMQLFWFEGGIGNQLFAFPFTYLLSEKRWVPNETTLLRPHQPNVLYAWNQVCIKCHAVAGQPHIQQHNVQTKTANLGIACESCHGPGQTHSERYKNPILRYLKHGNKEPDSTIINPRNLNGKQASQVCGQCHNASLHANHKQWITQGVDLRPGKPLSPELQTIRHPVHANQPWLDPLLQRDPSYLSGRFWNDGMIRISGREYNGYLESPCAKDPKFSCLSCHSMHQSQPDDQLAEHKSGNQACLPCHEKFRTQLEQHTHHQPNSSGSLCYNCHMPHTTYGLLKAIRSHQISNPNVEETARVGRPNACNLCHLQRSLGWTQKHLVAWYKHEPFPLRREEQEHSAAILGVLRGDAGQRVLWAWAMGWSEALHTSGNTWQAPFLAQLFADPYDAVRFVAGRSLRSLPHFSSFAYDHLANTSQRQERSQQAIDHWQTTWNPVSNPTILLTTTGIDSKQIGLFRSQRDETPIDLKE